MEEGEQTWSIRGFAISLDTQNNLFEIGFKSGSVNANRGIGLSKQIRRDRDPHVIDGVDVPGWTIQDGVLNRTDQKLVINYIQNSGLMEERTIKLADSLW